MRRVPAYILAAMCVADRAPRAYLSTPKLTIISSVKDSLNNLKRLYILTLEGGFGEP